MYLHRRVALSACLLAACGDPPAATATDSGEPSTSAPTTPSGPTVDSAETTAGAPTSSDGGGSLTDGATSEGTTAEVTGATETGPGPQTTGTTTSVLDTGDDTTTTSGPDTTTTGDTTTTTMSDDATTSDDTTTTGDTPVCACPDLEVPLDDGVFVLSNDAKLWKYFPLENTFVSLGSLSCGMTNTFSMAVDRLGFAWIQFSDGDLRTVPVNDLTQCSDPGYAPGQMGVFNFGMAFVSNSAADPCDRIYGNTWNGIPPFSESPNAGTFLGIDPDTLQVGKIGNTNFNGAEVTGTGDGRAFVFGGANPSKLVEYDKTTGAKLEQVDLGGLEINNGAFAFAFFGGDFYFFTDSNQDQFASEVTHLDYDDSDMNGIQDLKKVVNAAPLLVVGAGVSTCAPFAPQ